MVSPAPLHIGLSASGLRRALVALVATLSALGLAAEIGYALADNTDPYGLVAFAGLSYEQNLPTWVASGLLLGCAVLLWLNGRAGDIWRRHWYLLAALFAYGSLDEVAEIHEQWGGWLDTDGVLSGVLYYSWVIPAALLLLALGIACRNFVLQLPAPTRRRFIVAGLLYTGGALGMELPLGYWANLHGNDNLVYGLIDWVEETLELAGASLFFYALVLRLLEAPGGLALTLAAPATKRAADTS